MLGVLVGVWMGTLEKQLNKWDFLWENFWVWDILGL